MQPWVMFDMDGTLIESEQIWRDVRHEFVRTHGGRWHDGAQTTMIGMRTAEWSRYMHDELGVPLPVERIAAGVIDGVIERLRAGIPYLPGAGAVLERLAQRYSLGLVTSASLPVATFVAQQSGWERLFAIVLSADDVARGKPAPDVYLRALELARADARCTAAVEDSSNGIRAAGAARIPVVAIPNREFPPDPGALAAASAVVHDLSEVDAAVTALLPH